MKRVLLWLIAFYKRRISPALPSACRFYPTCSEYAYSAISKFGAFLGTILAFFRLLRCNPFSRGGYDPVPDTFIGAFSKKTREMNDKLEWDFSDGESGSSEDKITHCREQ